jgi:acetate kinase
MRVLALNCGSSSIKAAFIDSAGGERLLDMRVEGLGAEAVLQTGDQRRVVPVPTRTEAVSLVLQEVEERAAQRGSVEAVAHRIVHGGERLTQPTLIDERAAAELEALTPLAPLHNPPALEVVRAARTALPDAPHVAVFDTAFHSALPQHAREYALPEDVRRRHGLRRYGFHGVNHEHVMHAVAHHLRTESSQLRIVSCHLGAGASVAAIARGRSVDTSMGMTPLEGLVMATRAGDLDPGVLLTLFRDGGDVQALDELLNQRSGLVGLTGVADMREVERRAAAGEQDCQLALAMYVHRVRKYIGAYAAAMGGVEVVAFTGGVGEHSELIRRRCAERLDFLGVTLDEGRNREARTSYEQPVAEISAARSRTRAFVVRADEEQALARAAAALLEPQAG